MDFSLRIYEPEKELTRAKILFRRHGAYIAFNGKKAVEEEKNMDLTATKI